MVDISLHPGFVHFQCPLHLGHGSHVAEVSSGSAESSAVKSLVVRNLCQHFTVGEDGVIVLNAGRPKDPFVATAGCQLVAIRFGGIVTGDSNSFARVAAC